MEHVVVVTGVGQGIGRATARVLAERGFRVVGIERDPTIAPFTPAAGSAPDGASVVVHGDVAEAGVFEEALAAAEALGSLVGWVNNAARVDPDPEAGPVGDFLAGVLEVNVGAVARGTALAVRRFLDAGVTGSIVNVSSVHSRLGFAGYGAYDATKGAVEALTRSTAARFGPDGIRCNAVAPGAVLTEREVAARRNAPPAQEPIPLAMFSTPTEIAEVIAFLVSPASAAVNAAVIRADKGLSSVFVDDRWKAAAVGGIGEAIAL